MSIQHEIESTFSLYNIKPRRVDLGEAVLDVLGAVVKINPATYPAGFCYGQTSDGRWYVAVRVLHVTPSLPYSLDTPLHTVVIAYQKKIEDPSDWACEQLRTTGTFGFIMSKINETVHCRVPWVEGDPLGEHTTHTFAPF